MTSTNITRKRWIAATAKIVIASGAIAALRARVGIQGGLAHAGIREEHLAPLAQKAALDACHRSNPRPCSETDLLGLYRASL